jgi:hypothetical protein
MDVALNKLDILLLLLLFLVGCVPIHMERPIEISSTPQASNTEIQHPLPPTATLTPLASPTEITPIPTLEDPVLVSYEHDANDSMDNFTACLFGLNTFSFVLYKNGHVILFNGSQFMETTIDQVEIEKLLADIESTGFFLLKGDGDEFLTPPPTPSFIGTSRQIIRVQDKTFIITTGEYKYLAASVKDTIETSYSKQITYMGISHPRCYTDTIRA